MSMKPKGLGVGGVKRQNIRRYDKAIEGAFKGPSMKRLSMRAGVKNLSAGANEDARGFAVRFCDKVINGALHSMKSRKAATLSEKDIDFALYGKGMVVGSKTVKSSTTKKDSFVLAIKKVSQQVHPDSSLSQDAASQVNDFLHALAHDLTESASKLVSSRGAKTLKFDDLVASVGALFPRELKRHCISEMEKSRYKKDQKNAGLSFQVSRATRVVRANMLGCKNVSTDAAIGMAAALEYIALEVLELGGNAARDAKKKVIKPFHIAMGVRNDAELRELMDSVGFLFARGGVKNDIHSTLMPKRSESSRMKQKQITKIRKEQKRTDLDLAKGPMHMLVRSAARDKVGKPVRVSANASESLQSALESHLIELFRSANKIAINAGRKTVMPKDVRLAAEQAKK